MSQIDGILIDDDVWVRSHWEQRCRLKGKTIRTFASVTQFIERCHKVAVDRMTPIFVDSRLNDDRGLGEEQSKEIYAAGFRNIFLASAMPLENGDDYPHLRGCVSKEPPTWLFGDDDVIARTRHSLLEKMSCEQRCRFDKRMAELNDYRNGVNQEAFPFADGSGAYWPTEVLDAWESALYHDPIDSELERVIHEAWLETTY